MKKKKVFLKALSVLLAVITAGAALYSNGAAAESKEGAALFAEVKKGLLHKGMQWTLSVYNKIYSSSILDSTDRSKMRCCFYIMVSCFHIVKDRIWLFSNHFTL